CNKKELLAESDLINHEEWKEYSFKFEPKQRATYIIFEAFFQTPTLSPPNGNLLLDNASPIEMLPCDEELPLVRKPEVHITSPIQAKKTVTQKTFDLIAKLANVKKKSKILFKINGRNNRSFTFNPTTQILKAKVKLREGENIVSIKAANSVGSAKDRATLIYEPPVVAVTPPPKPKEAKIVKDLKSLKKGEKIRVDELYFDINSHTITEASIPVLNDIFKFLQKNQDVKVEIGGHTNRNCDTQYCNELSKNRAKAVVDYLIAKGISPSRLSFKGYGKTKPLTFSKNANAQKKNQRVEIKIL
ncbi:MAG TPA: OmpA family protein, partial [Phaeodactylibacter sp.]|nr:OmpA family protein [Phaeodactylibacter sp.]